MEKFFEELLNSRERRYNKQLELINKYEMPIISFMLNVPGIEKRNDKLVSFHKLGIEIIKSAFKDLIIDELYVNENTGMYYLASINLPAEEVKRISVDLENSEIGRLFDIDVFSENAEQLSRSSLGMEMRKCLICEGYAKLCILERKHKYEDLIDKMNEIIDSNLGKL